MSYEVVFSFGTPVAEFLRLPHSKMATVSACRFAAKQALRLGEYELASLAGSASLRSGSTVGEKFATSEADLLPALTAANRKSRPRTYSRPLPKLEAVSESQENLATLAGKNTGQQDGVSGCGVNKIQATILLQKRIGQLQNAIIRSKPVKENVYLASSAGTDLRELQRTMERLKANGDKNSITEGLEWHQKA